MALNEPQREMGWRRYVWSGVGWISLAMALLGIPLPLLPTTPFALLSLFAFSKSYPPMRGWILRHPILGPPVLRWKERRSIDPNTRRLAVGSVIVSFSLSFWLFREMQWLCLSLAVLMVTLTAVLLRLPVETAPLTPQESDARNCGIDDPA